MNLVTPIRTWSVLGLALGCSMGCEHQFFLSARNPETIHLTSSRGPVSRDIPPPGPTSPVPASGPSERPLSDRGVILSNGYRQAYRKDGEWIVSVAPVGVEEHGNALSISYMVHPGRSDLPLRLTTDRNNICSLQLRKRPSHAWGYAGLVVGGMTAGLGALGDRKDWPYFGVTAGALVLAGAAMLLWPAGTPQTVVPESCAAASTPPP